MSIRDETVTAAAFREAMAKLASAVHLVTTDGRAGRAGFTASSVCSVSDAPPTLLVCVNRDASAHAAFDGNDVLCVNTLAASQAAIAGSFGGRTPMQDRFACAEWRTLATGALVLPGALAAFDCRIVGRTSMRTHDVLFCEVMALCGAEGDSLIYAERRYRTLAPQTATAGAEQPVQNPPPPDDARLRPHATAVT